MTRLCAKTATSTTTSTAATAVIAMRVLLLWRADRVAVVDAIGSGGANPSVSGAASAAAQSGRATVPGTDSPRARVPHVGQNWAVSDIDNPQVLQTARPDSSCSAWAVFLTQRTSRSPIGVVQSVLERGPDGYWSTCRVAPRSAISRVEESARLPSSTIERHPVALLAVAGGLHNAGVGAMDRLQQSKDSTKSAHLSTAAMPVNAYVEERSVAVLPVSSGSRCRSCPVRCQRFAKLLRRRSRQ